MSVAPPATASPVLFDPARLDRADTLLRATPFHFLVARDQLPQAAASELERDFPKYPSAGFFPYEEKDCGPSVNALIRELTDPAVASAVGARLGIDDLGRYPTLVTLCRLLNKRHGTIHTDSRSKVATALLYLNPSWPDISEGCLRFLNRVDDIDDLVAPEIKPLYGNFVVFRRAENSFHGHLPHEGERRVIQVAWLTSEDEKLRKTQRGKFSRLFKKLFGSLDRKFGASRDKNAAHKD
ncbi:MAG: 2OG-Fe(II) oxygenase [Proteobacteria bacterium]|uniref:2OG-Fe(II) oxygenase n=1 Tax=Rudaea sp. TaxID=2136325 RepID=UPI001E0C57F8|nr:2OG-Fe(II) oxygenase [Pseudomonadota bacterium]MBS0568943.1 2OG-Fe(II) oxygenase [Pseudomonadota bacterium]